MRPRLIFSSAFFVASSVFIPQVNADMRNEFNQQQIQQQKDNQSRKSYCSNLLAQAQFKSENQYPVIHYYLAKPKIIEIEDVSNHSSYTGSGKYCKISERPYLGIARKVKYSSGEVRFTYVSYIEDGELVEYTDRWNTGKIERIVLGVKK